LICSPIIYDKNKWISPGREEQLYNRPASTEAAEKTILNNRINQTFDHIPEMH
jgi:hypothetical protein